VGQQGFSLVENLLAIAILSFVLLALVVLASTIITSKATTKKRVTAITLAQDQIEDVRRSGYRTTLFINETKTETITFTGLPPFKRVTFTQVNTPAMGMQTVTVTVYWDADARLFTLSTILAP
jgi:prepilin-type N-terminal cleavage/methylation domain-containing protein